jgi:predicted ATP-binding protein involved in virulence
MYIKEITIENIRSITHLEMKFPKEAGWHVLIGDNGSGKSSVLKGIVMSIIPVSNVHYNKLQRKEGADSLFTLMMSDKSHKDLVSCIYIHNNDSLTMMTPFDTNKKELVLEKSQEKVFIVGFGPFRRFNQKENGNSDSPIIENFRSLFDDNANLTESLSWLQNLDYQRLEGNQQAGKILEYLRDLMNQGDLLQNGITLKTINSKGVFFQDEQGNEINIKEMSDGYQSILSLTFELIRQLVRTFEPDEVFKNFTKKEYSIASEGVVLIDEIDAHLHPTWQVRIGQWFTKYFPNIQFIVTTHSPLVCRACENGTIWRLATPNSDETSGEITGVEKDRLVFGNILDAYGTEVFGQNVVRSEQSEQKLHRLGKLNIKSALGKLNAEEQTERLQLQKILATDAPTGF